MVVGLILVALASVFFVTSAKAVEAKKEEKEMTGVEFKNKFFMAYSNAESLGLTKGIPASLAYAVASLETGRGRGQAFQASQNLFSIHAGAGLGKPNKWWDGRTHTTDPTGKPSETLRVYNSWQDSIADFCDLISTRPWAAKAYAMALANKPTDFFQAMQESGYAGKSQVYAVGLKRTYAEVA